MNLPRALIVDLDGTLCDHYHRLHYIYRELWARKERINGVLPDKLFKPDYDSFYAVMSEDKLNEWCSWLIDSCIENYVALTVIFVTGRPERYRGVTQDWICSNCPFLNTSRDGLLEVKLLMRPDYLECSRLPKYTEIEGVKYECEYSPEFIRMQRSDNRPAHEVKREIYDREIRGKYDITFCLDDDPKCVTMYRDLGLVCLDVGRK